MQYMTTCHRISTELQVMIGSTSISPHTCTRTQHTWNTIHHLWLCCNYRPCSKLHRSLIGCAVTPVPLNLLNNTLTHTHTFLSISTLQRYLYSKKRVVVLETQQIICSISPNTLTGPCRSKGCVISVISGSVQKSYTIHYYTVSSAYCKLIDALHLHCWYSDPLQLKQSHRNTVSSINLDLTCNDWLTILCCLIWVW